MINFYNIMLCKYNNTHSNITKITITTSIYNKNNNNNKMSNKFHKIYKIKIKQKILNLYFKEEIQLIRVSVWIHNIIYKAKILCI